MFFQDVAPRLVGDGRAAQLAAAWPFGLLCSVYIAGGVFATLSPRAQVMLSVVLNAVSVAALGGLAVLSLRPIENEAGVAAAVGTMFSLPRSERVPSCADLAPLARSG